MAKPPSKPIPVEVNGLIVDGKKCRTCEELKPLTEFHVGDGIGGRQAHCKTCRNDRRRKTNVRRSPLIDCELDGVRVDAKKCNNCGEIKPLTSFVKSQAGIAQRAAVCKECNRLYREENRGRIAQGKKRYYEEHKPKIKQAKRDWYFDNREDVRQRVKMWYRDNIDHVRAYRAANYDRESAVMRTMRWRKDNPLKYRAQLHRRESLERHLESSLTEDELGVIYRKFDSRCALTDSQKVDLDHFIPLSWGHGGTYYGNIYPLDSSLNCSKHNKNPFKWVTEEHIYRQIDETRWFILVEWLASVNGLTTDEFVRFVYWCEDNRREIGDVQSDKRPSLVIWKGHVT